MSRLGMVAVFLLSLSLFMLGNAWGEDLGDAYYPLKAGMRWEYSVTSEKIATKKLIISNLAPREINGQKVIPRKWEMGGTTFYQLMAKDDSGIYRYAEQDGENAPPQVITPKEYHIKYPIAEGTTWDMNTKLGNDRLTVNFTMESVTEDITVPAGTFKDCLKIKEKGGDEAGPAVLGYEWYAPQVGVLKSMVTIKQKSKEGAMVSEHRTYQLESFKP